ncbi:MAG: LysR family transcriptional regulator, partial [Proteobacteria bacterium]|nr:LysR family transcriptional regulator [Pseudomonadota bacterium]
MRGHAQGERLSTAPYNGARHGRRGSASAEIAVPPLRIRPDCGIHATMSQNGFRNITLHQMEALIRLVETGSFTHAAERMALSQPTLTKHIRNLE